MVAIGIRNNNPLNIRLSNEHWEGASKNQTDKTFVVFESPEWGFNAAYQLLCTYRIKYFCRTLGSIISKYAPPAEKDTLTYIKFVCSVCRCEPETLVDINDIDFMAKFIMAITRLENGSCPYSLGQIKKGIKLKDVKGNS